ncbi:MAG TPA: Maf family protein [Candidatus Obscuribacterales bacterium]
MSSRAVPDADCETAGDGTDREPTTARDGTDRETLSLGKADVTTPEASVGETTASAAGKTMTGEQIHGPRLVLASMSPRRIELLKNLNLKFDVIPSHCDESYSPDATPDEVVISVARKKAHEVLNRLQREQVLTQTLIVLAADTMVVLDGVLLGKPSSYDEAVAMISRLQNRCHVVHTGVVLLRQEIDRRDGAANPNSSDKQEECVTLSQDETDKLETLPRAEDHIPYVDRRKGKLKEWTVVERSKVFFRELTMDEMRAYVDTGEPMDKAGAYALQGIGAALVERVEGCVSNIIGLPVPQTVQLLRKSGIKILGLP